MERYEHRQGASSKFWEVETKNNKLIVRWGRIGTKGQAQEKTFASEILTHGVAQKLIAEKLGKGYVLVSSAKTSTPSIKSRKEPKKLIKLWKQYQPEHDSFVSIESEKDKVERLRIREEKSAAYSALLKILDEHADILELSDLVTLLVNTCYGSKLYQSVLAKLLEVNLDDKEVVLVINKLRCSDVRGEDTGAILAKYLERKKPGVADLVKIFKKFGLTSHWATYGKGTAQPILAAVRKYLSPADYKVFRTSLDPNFRKPIDYV